MPKRSIHAVTAAAALACLAAFVTTPISASSAAAQAAGPSPAAPRFVPGACPKPPEPIEALSKARCGFLEVPENRSRPGGRTVKLAVAVIPAAAEKPSADPVVFMAGGPGADTFDDIPFLMDSGLNKHRDLIVMAQRGNLYDQPNLACPEVDRFNEQAVGLGYDSQRAERLMLKAVKDCRGRLTAAGVDLSAYNTTENAADFADLRKALDIPKWNVYGYSYGSNLALTYLRLHPEGVRAVAIDSVTPPQVATLPWGWGSAAEGIHNIFQARGAARLQDPVPRPPPHADGAGAQAGGPPPDVERHPAERRKARQGRPRRRRAAEPDRRLHPRPKDMPAALDELSRGNPKRFAQARAAGSVQNVGAFAHGLTNSIACSEWAPGYSESDVLKAGRKAFPGWPDTVLAQVPQLPFQYPVCGIWNVPDRAKTQRVATVSSVPALLVSGTFDVKTGASWAKGVAHNLSRSTAIRVPGIGHWVVPQSPCAQRVLASFLARPTAPDTSCVDDLEPEPFTITPK